MAQRHPSSRRRGRGDSKDAEPDDVFIARLVEFSTWAKANTQTLVLFGVVLAVIVGGVFYYVNFRRTLEDQALIQLEQIQQTVRAGEPAAARAEVSQFLQRFEGTNAADEARLLLAGLHVQDGQYDEAIRVLDESGISLREPMGVQMETLRAKALEAAGREEEAESAYLRVADAAELDFQRIAALEDAARVRIAGEDYEGAAELYERILDGLEETHPDRGSYEMRLAEIRAAARS